jgi:hypothetical protein
MASRVIPNRLARSAAEPRLESHFANASFLICAMLSTLYATGQVMNNAPNEKKFQEGIDC